MDTKALRQKVLDLAIRGKLVPQDPNDEPASVLLERIRQQKQQMVKEGKLKAKDIKNDTIIFVGEDNLHYEKFADDSVKCIEDEIPFELPDGWAWERLSNLASFSGGKTPSTSRSEYWDGDILWVTSKDMKSKYITSSQLRLSTLGAEQMQMYQPDTLLLVTRSGILRHTLPVAILKECATINQDLKAIILYMPQLAEYIYVCLKGMETQLLLKYTKSGTTVENVNFDEFQKVLLPIPPIQQIDRIMSSTGSAESVVSTIEDDKAALADYVIKAKSKILDLAIRGQLVPQDPDDEPASVLLERIRAEKEELIKQGKLKRDKKESVIFRGEDNSYYLRTGELVESLEDWDLEDPDERWYKLVLRDTPEVLDEVRAAVRAAFAGRFTFADSAPAFFELNAPGCSKANAVRFLRKRYPGARIICCGDYGNDLAMLTAADLAVCPSNATDEVKAVSHLCLCPHTEGLIADLLPRLR